MAAPSSTGSTGSVGQQSGGVLLRRHRSRNDNDDEKLLDNKKILHEKDSHLQHRNRRLFAAFWCIGVLNHSAYILMIACAKDILEGATALVFLANIVPGLIIKTSAPYWFHAVPYGRRIQAATLTMMTGYILLASATRYRVAYIRIGTTSSNGGQVDPPLWILCVQLLGVALANAQCSLGEASLLAYAGRLDAELDLEQVTQLQAQAEASATASGLSSDVSSDINIVAPIQKNKGPCLTCLSSGTGMAGVFGFFWKWFWCTWMGLTLSQTLTLALSLGVGYYCAFQFIERHQPPIPIELAQVRNKGDPLEDRILDGIGTNDSYQSYGAPSVIEMAGDMELKASSAAPNNNDLDGSMTEATCMLNASPALTLQKLLPTSATAGVIPVPDMTSAQRFKLVLSLWPYAVPLFLVYAAEYALQSGTWTAIGFPVQDRESRTLFYQYSNWIYFVGSFISRSSGVFYTPPMWLLWLMPILQLGNLIVTTHAAAHPTTSVLYHPFFLYTVALYTGLLGGSVYISGYKRICADIPLAHREFALSAVSLAETVGIVVADLVGLVIQACLYRANGLDKAMLTCPI